MAIDFNSAALIYQQINGTKLEVLKQNLYNKAIEYAHIRALWHNYTIDEKIENEISRSAIHNTFIDACNILSRNQINSNEDNSWRNKLGNDRKIIGDFACYLHLFIGLNNR